MAMGEPLLGDGRGVVEAEDAEEEEVCSGVAPVAAAEEGSLRQPPAAVEEMRRREGQSSSLQGDPPRLNQVSRCTCSRATGCDAASASRNMMETRGPPVVDVDKASGSQQERSVAPAGAAQRRPALVEKGRDNGRLQKSVRTAGVQGCRGVDNRHQRRPAVVERSPVGHGRHSSTAEAVDVPLMTKRCEHASCGS